MHFIDVIVILLAVVVFVPLFHRVRLGPVLGFLVAAIVIGPFGMGLARDEEVTQVLEELGVAFLLWLFDIDLDLPLERIRLIPKRIFGLGLAQLSVTGGLIAIIVLALGGSAGAAIIVGGGLALSSTALVLRLLSDRNELSTRFGRKFPDPKIYARAEDEAHAEELTREGANAAVTGVAKAGREDVACSPGPRWGVATPLRGRQRPRPAFEWQPQPQMCSA
jgi:hypothetical protein